MIHSRRSFFSDLGKNVLDAVIPPASASTSTDHRLVIVSLRGGMDGLNTIIPYGDTSYYTARPTLAVNAPGNGNNSAIDLDGYFALNPELALLKPLYDAGNFAVVHATGAPFVTRSHFEAKRSMEAAYGTNERYSDGWLSRYLTSSNNNSPFGAISVKSSITQSLMGSRSAVALGSIDGFDLTTRNNLDFQAVINALYVGESGRLGRQASDTLDALSLLDFYNPASIPITIGIKYPKSVFGDRLSQTAKYIKSGLGTEIYCLEVGDWDHHKNLNKRLGSKLNDIAACLDAFCKDLGNLMDNTTIIVMSEFGRRVAENASMGTDHGRGGCMFVLGNGVNGGHIYANWPGLADHQLNDGCLEITTDYRIILAEFLRKRMPGGSLDTIFPNFDYSHQIGIFL